MLKFYKVISSVSIVENNRRLIVWVLRSLTLSSISVCLILCSNQQTPRRRPAAASLLQHGEIRPQIQLSAPDT